MCGINGFNFIDRDLIQKMNESIKHRGPDASGFFCEEGVSLGHNRLSIIDLSISANQPMFDKDNDLVIIFNGEIYNFEELKKEIKNYNFKTKSDTEVILAGYRKWGKEVVKKLNGMFAFAIWDKRKSELFIARDRSGIKPLYYFWSDNRFIFSSEVKAILLHDIPRKLNHEAFNQYLRVLYVPSPMTMIENVFKLSPGHTLTLKNNKLDIQSYIKDESVSVPSSYNEAKHELREKTIESVKRQLVSDVPVGVYLSGGIDSSVILFAMSKFKKNIKTFSVGFDLEKGEESKKFNYDFELAKNTANFFGVDHHPILMSKDDAVSMFEEMITQNDDPISNPTSIAMMYLARQAKKDVSVVLSGNGGDELFGGYERYRLALLSSYYNKMPKLFKKIGNLNSTLNKFNAESGIDIFARFMFEKDNKLSMVISGKIFKDDHIVKKYFNDKYFSLFKGDVVDRFMRTDTRSWLPDQALQLADKMSMASSLEERVPLLDNELITFANSLPRNFKVTLGATKKIFKEAFKRDLPGILFSQPKRGWFSPGAKWLRYPKFTKMAKEILSENYYKETAELFNWDKLELMFDDHISMKEYNLTALWAIMVFQAWAKQYKILV